VGWMEARICIWMSKSIPSVLRALAMDLTTLVQAGLSLFLCGLGALRTPLGVSAQSLCRGVQSLQNAESGI
jgi:hypothetical protein